MNRLEELSRFSGQKISQSNSDYLVYEPLMRLLRGNISKYAKGRVLDIGCGNKPYESYFKGLTEEYIGCDVVQSDQNKVDVICEANNIPLESNTFDTVFTTQVIEHVADHHGLLSEAFRLLKPGGYLIVSGPMYWPLHEEPHDFFRFTKYGFSYLLNKHGFQEIEIAPCGGKWALTGIVLIYAIPGRPRILSRILNPLFAWLDRSYPDYGNTTNYVVVGRKL
jgi:SAM-dependent methyltransferase